MKSFCLSAPLVGVAVLAWTAILGPTSVGSAAASFPKDSKTVLHVLNRTAFGARPGDVGRVQEMGLQRYIEQQLHPERLADSATNARLSSFPTLTMSSPEIAERYEIPALDARRKRRNESARSGVEDAGGHPQDAVADAENKGRQVVIELSEAKLVRAIYSERQLEEVLTDFWFNHFNVDARKGAGRSCSPSTSVT